MSYEQLNVMVLKGQASIVEKIGYAFSTTIRYQVKNSLFTVNLYHEWGSEVITGAEVVLA